ncbi:MAG: hypothetical protein K6T75_08235 [Acetobacteraceae bacterium]|nr:hypothetical protein [Acetobacteraceae bacterium]
MAAPPSGWTRYADPAGFSLECPQGWKVAVSPQGVITACSGEPSAASSGVVFWPSEGGGFRSAEDLVDAVVALLEPVLGGVSQAARRQAGTSDAAVLVGTLPGGRRVVLVAATGAEGALVSGLWATPEAYASQRARMLRSLASFRLTLAPGLQGRSAWASLVRIRESREGAFTIKVPEGWQVEAVVERPYIDASFVIRATHGQRGVYISTLHPPLYAVPNQLLLWAGFGEGSRYNPGGAPIALEVRSYRTAARYLEEFALAELQRTWPGTRLTGIQERPDLAAAVVPDPFTAQVTAAEGSFTEPGGRVHRYAVITRLLSFQGTGLWQVAVTHFWAPASEIGLMESLVRTMEASLEVDPGWAEREAEQVRIRTGIIGQTGREIADIISSTFRYQSEVHDRVSHAWSHAILGTVDVYDPETGESWTVPSDSRHYWERAGVIFGTETADPPAPDPAFRELLIEDWMRPAGP